MPTLTDEQVKTLVDALKTHQALMFKLTDSPDRDNTGILWFTAISDQFVSDYPGTVPRRESSFFFKEDTRGDGSKIMVMYSFASHKMRIIESLHDKGEEYDGKIHLGDAINEVTQDYLLPDLPKDIYDTLLDNVLKRIQRHHEVQSAEVSET